MNKHNILNKIIHDMRCLLFLLISISITSCNNYSSELRSALKEAGTNRSELEYVLNYYSQNKKDSLKLKAAKFLIENMPYYYSYSGKSIRIFKETLKKATKDGFVGKAALDFVEKTCGFPDFAQLEVVRDIQVIKSGFLIKNIDQSFMVWEKQPWGKSISFNDFCEYILPYRIDNEPLDDWKSSYYEHYQPLIDSLKKTVNVIEASNIIYQYITKDPWIFIAEIPGPHFGSKFLFDERTGSCRERCDLAIYVMRSLGIPVGTDMVLHNPDQSGKHFWNFVLDENGKSVEFTLWDEAPLPNLKQKFVKKRGKVYRNKFSINKEFIEIFKKGKNTPTIFKKYNIVDISKEYFKSNRIKFAKNELGSVTKGLVFLAVFDTNGWCPIYWGEIKNKELVLENIDYGVMYTLCSYNENTFEPISYPFFIDTNSKKHFLTPSKALENVKLERKFTMKFMQEHMVRFSGGKFEASNNKDFNKAIELYVIDSIQTAKYFSIKINNVNKYKYVRYFSPDNSLCNMAEMSFLDQNGNELIGTVIGSDGAINNETKLMKQAVFDKDPLTFFNAPDIIGMWVGLKFPVAKTINTITYLPFEISRSHKSEFLGTLLNIKRCSLFPFFVPNEIHLFLSK